jgi:hypothetical protein
MNVTILTVKNTLVKKDKEILYPIKLNEDSIPEKLRNLI